MSVCFASRQNPASLLEPIVDAGAAPHRPAGTFSPYSDGKKGTGRSPSAFLATIAIGNDCNWRNRR
ncbi:hypothetical protein FJ953_26035 [Mesorhizobium sp. B2-3-6]|nr:hypothetical protein FJ551_23770 [Mesorhizobium sp. B2-5-1]TPL15792.1 hypothetical protein FJ952_19215 [Mesorhizobium sp. B2-4-10]TPM14615.1 hypothetical protein FJ953_26035 [Mesorhizobium sp. B2-3-6]TPN08335.1 hypothetical protein FJ971_19995 [Mesorhizobium sp. B2-1-2]